MKKNIFFLLLAITMKTIAQISILPTPIMLTEKQLQFKIASNTRIILGSGSKEEEFIASLINEELTSLNESPLKITDANSVRKLTANYIFIGKSNSDDAKKLLQERKATLQKEMAEEGYFLDVSREQIVIIAESDKGLFYGVQSLLQCLKKEKRSVVVQGMTVKDYPLQSIRGITDDISRGQISTVDNFKKIIRFCARYKMNTYCPYIEDVFAFKKHPDVWKNRGALNAQEWKEIDTYAKKYFVEVIPIFETLGHWENILLQSNYVKYGEFPGAHTINVSDEKALTILDEMIGEIAAAFSSPYFNIAADESWDVGLGANKERVAKSDIATVHAEHYKRVFSMVKKYGKKPMMYGDIILDHPEILKKIPKDVVIVDWHYGTAFTYPSTETFKNAGFPYVVSPAVWNFTGPFPNYINTFLNIQYLNAEGFKNNSLGILCSNWNDFGGEALRELNYYGYAWNAECAWNPNAADQQKFNGKFFSDFYGASELSELQTVYNLLSSPANQYHWYELWRHPLLPNRDDMIWEKRLPLIQRMQSIQSQMPFAIELLKKSAKNISCNHDHLQYLEFVAKLNLWFAKKIEAQEKIKILLKLPDSTKVVVKAKEQIVELCNSVVMELQNVKKEFERVWLTTYKREGLNLLLNRYDRQIAYWNELAEQIQKNNFTVEPQIQSQWIYHPKSNPGVKDSVQTPKVVFKKTFTAKKNISSAKLQLLGDTWSKLSINGKFIGEVFARRSLSLIVENERAKIFDIAPYLTDSINTILIESQNFQENSSAGTNVYCEIQYSDGTNQIVMSDVSWKAAEQQKKSDAIPDSLWQQAVAKKYSVPVVAPNLSTGRTSWFER